MVEDVKGLLLVLLHPKILGGYGTCKIAIKEFSVITQGDDHHDIGSLYLFEIHGVVGRA